MLTDKDYTDSETTLELQKLGIPVWYIYHDLILHKTQTLLYHAQKWLREEKKIGVFVSGFKNGYTFWIINLLNGDTLYQGFFDNQTGEKYKTYEEALLEGIKEAVKLLKEE